MADLLTVQPGVQIDLARSHLILDGRRIPAGCVTIPHSTPDDLWGGTHRLGWDVWVPAENGLVFHVQGHDNDRLHVGLYAAVCEPVTVPPDDASVHWLPCLAYLPWGEYRVARVIHDTTGAQAPDGLWYWAQADVAYVAELIPRLSVYDVHDLRGAPLTWHPLSTAPWEVPTP